MKTRTVVVIAASVLLSWRTHAQSPAPDADTVIKAITTAMGTAQLRSLQYTGTGSIYSTGQAYQAGGAWPRYTLTKYTMSVDYGVPAMRQELVRVDDVRPPLGGGAGGYNPTTFQGGIRPVPGDIVQNQTLDARQQNGAIAFWLTPHGFVKGATANLATAKVGTARGKRTVSFTGLGKFPITATIDNRNMIEKVEALVDVGYTGDTVLDGTYTEYRDLDGVRVPMHIVMREGGFPTLELAVAQARPNSQEAVDVVARATSTPSPAAAAPRAEPPQPLKLADGVWALTPAIEGSTLVEFKDYLVMIEAPAGDAYGAAAMESAKRLAPDKPINYVINTHHHADHAGGMRAYVSEGIPIVTHESHRKYYEDVIFKNPHSLNPDRLARMPRPAVLETIKDKQVFTDGNQVLELHLMRGQPHADGMLMAYLPKDKLLIQADAYVPRPGAPPLPVPSPHTMNFVDNVSRLKLDVDRVVHIHGGSSPYSDVLASVGRSRSTN
jgi:glyoxylase-like metal-dependent hydrolase (beta-lactamase superfamily II)